MKNKLSDLNNHLFAQLERLSDEDIKGEDLDEEIRRAEAVCNVATQIIDNGSLALKAEKMKQEYGSGTGTAFGFFGGQELKIHYYTAGELDFLRKFAYGHSYKEITDAINAEFGLSLGVNQIRACLRNHKITTGRTGRFEKGHVPANKGKHQPTVGRMAETQFQKGNIPKNHKPVGTVSVRHNYKKGQTYVYEKVAEPNVWRMKHILEWEKHNGPVPKGKAIIFADGDTTNTDINNLVMVDRSQLAVMNRWNLKGSGRELMETAANTAALKISISKAKKGKEETQK